MGNQEAFAGEGKYKVLIICGSLRKQSTNAGLLRAIVEAGHPNLEFQWANINDLPLYNEDLQAKGIPPSVQRVKDQVNKCQGLLFGVTENNGSVSAAMKNAYDWISRNGLIKGFPAGMVSVGGGASGLNGQKALKQIGEYFEIKFMSGHDIALNRFADPTLFDAEGNLLKAEVKEKLKGYNIALASWIHSHSHKKQAEKAPHA